MELKQKIANLNQLVTESLCLIEEIAQQAEIKLLAQLSPALPINQKFDPIRMKQVLINLTINAIQASPMGETVLVQTETEKDHVVLSVIDHGPGISTDQFDLLVKPFYTTKKEGTGLGLSIVNKIVSAHQGRLEVQTNPEGGSTFKVRLPIIS